MSTATQWSIQCINNRFYSTMCSLLSILQSSSFNMTLTAHAHVAVHSSDCWNTNSDTSLWKSLKTSRLSNVQSMCLYIQTSIPWLRFYIISSFLLVLPQEHMFFKSGILAWIYLPISSTEVYKREGNPLSLLMCLPSSFDWCVGCHSPLSSSMLLSQPFTEKRKQHSKNNIYLTQNFRF